MPEPMPWETMHYPTRRPALLIGIAAVIGCALAQGVNLPGWAQVAGALGGCALLALAALPLLRSRAAAGMLAGLAVLMLFAAWTGWRLAPAPGSLGEVFAGEETLVRLRGEVAEGGNYLRRDPAAFEYPEAPEPQRDFPVGADPRRNVSYLVSVEELPDMGLPTSGFVRLYAPPGTQLAIGSRIEVLGRLRKPRRPGNPGEVDSRERHERRGISHTITVTQPGQITLLGGPSPMNPARLASWVHEAFHEHLGARMPPGRAAVIGAALLGERGGLSMGQRADFVRSGTVHLLVVSGLHVALLAAAVVFVLRAFGVDPRWGWAIAGGVALLYLGVTGLQPSSLRATTMVCVYALGRVLLRRPDSLNVLGASAAISLVVNPGDVAELGFQLSFLAVLGILVLSPALRLRKPVDSPEGRGIARTLFDWLGGSVRVSVAVALATMPLLASTVHMISPAMVITNIVAGPLLMMLLVAGLLSPLAVIPGVGAALAFVLSLLGGALEFIAGFFARVPGGHLFLPAPPLWWLVAYYAALAGVVLLPAWRLPRVSGAAIWLIVLCILPARTLVSTEPPGPATLTALDVGQGQCVVIEVPQGPCVVLDCGSTSMGAVGERVLAPYLWARGRGHIDTLIISHADADHVNGLPQVFERFAVGEVLVPETFEDDETGRALRPWLDARAPVRVLQRGEWLELAPRLHLHALWPDAAYMRGLFPGERNDGGLVLELEAAGRRVLLPNDVEHRGLAGVMPRYESRGVDVLFAPHQGSAVTGLDGLLQRLRPAHIVITAREAFPADESLQLFEATGADLWRTWDHGAITITLSADSALTVAPYLSHQPPQH